jgi:hypothetical protein
LIHLKYAPLTATTSLTSGILKNRKVKVDIIAIF